MDRKPVALSGSVSALPLGSVSALPLGSVSALPLGSVLARRLESARRLAGRLLGSA